MMGKTEKRLLRQEWKHHEKYQQPVHDQSTMMEKMGNDDVPD